MKRYAILIIAGGLAIFAVLRALTSDKGPNPVRGGADSTTWRVAPAPGEAAPPAIPAGVESVELAPAEAELVDGSVAREWGTFIGAKDVRVNCRDVRQVVRPVPRPEDYTRRCDLKTVFNHPYAFFTDAQLEQIAGYDAAAAYLLAYRMLMRPGGIHSGDELEEALSYALDALVWTGEKQAFDLLIDGRHFPDRSVWSTVNGVPTASEIREKEEQYVWLKAGRDLGLVEDDDFRWTLLTRAITRYQQYFDVAALDERAERFSDRIGDRRSIVTGGESQ